MANQNDNAQTNQSIVYQDNQVFLYKPESASSRSTVYIRPGDLIQLNFDIKEARVEVVNGDLHIVFANGATMTLLSLAAMGFSTAAPVIRDTEGNLMDVAEFLNKTYTVNYNNAYLILTNRDDYNLSDEEPDAIVSAADSTETLDGGNPISGAGTTDVFINGVITSDVVKGVVNSKTFKTGKGNLPETNFTTNNPFTETSSNYLPGTIDENGRPVLSYKIFYGVDFKDNGNKVLEGNNGTGSKAYARSFSVAQGLDDSDDKTLLLDSAKLDLSKESGGVLVLSTLTSMEYLFDLNYTGGLFPTTLSIRVPKDSGLSIESPIVRPLLDSEGKSTGVYQFISIDQSGSSKFSVKFPYGLSARVLDLIYEVNYLDPITSENKFASYNQTLKINPVTNKTDLGDDNEFVLSNGAPGVDVVSGNDSDVLFGGAADNKILSAGGNDYVFSGVANDVVDLGLGNDSYWASLGVDRIEGGTGLDTAYYNNYANKIKKDAKKVDSEYEVGNLLDKTGETIKDEFFNTYSASKGLIFNVGASDIASKLYLEALLERYEGVFEVGSYINPTTVLVIKEQSKSDDGRFNLFDLYSNTEIFYGVDKLTDVVKFDYNGNTNYSRFTFYAGDSFKSLSYDSVVVDKNQGVTVDMSKATDNKNFVTVNFNNKDLEKSSFSGYNIFEASDKDDVIYGGIGFNKFADYDYTMYGSGSDKEYIGQRFGEGYTIYGGLGNDTVDYSKDSRIIKIEFNAVSGKITKYYEVTLTNATGATKRVQTTQSDILAINKSGLGYIEKIVGTERADTFMGGLKTSSASSSLSYTYQNNFTTQDVLTYATSRGNAVTLVLGAGGSRQVYKGTINDENFIALHGANALNTQAGLTNLLDFNKNIKDTVVGNISVTLSMGSDFIVSEEQGNYSFGAGTDLNAFWSQSVKDYVAYTAVNGGIVLNYTGTNGQVTVEKNGKGQDTFNFYDTAANREEIYGVYGTEYNDTFNLGNGIKDERHKIFGAGVGDNDTISFDSVLNVGITIQLGIENYARVVDGAIYLFEGVENVVGSKQNDKVIISSKAEASSLSNISIDLGGGNDEVDFSNASVALTGGNGLNATFEDGKITAKIGGKDLTFLNAESAKGTAYNDTFVVKATAQEGGIYDGFVGDEDFIDYSDVSDGLTFDLSKGATFGEVTRSSNPSSTIKDQIKDIEKIQGGLGNNTFKSNAYVNYIFQGGVTAATSQVLDYSELGVGVVFDIENQINYKSNYTGKLYLDAVASGDYSLLAKDTYTNITDIVGSKGDDSFLLNATSINKFKIDGGKGQYDILDLSSFSEGIETTLFNTNTDDFSDGITSLAAIDGFYNQAITSGTTNYNVEIRNISGLKLTNKNDEITLDGVASFYIDAGAGKDRVVYQLTDAPVYSFADNLAIAVDVTKDNLGVSKYYSPVGPSGTALVKSDKLVSVEALDLSSKNDTVKVKEWNTSIASINGAGGKNTLSFSDFAATKPTVITAKVGLGTDHKIEVSNNQISGTFNAFNFTELVGAGQKNVTVDFVLNDFANVDKTSIVGRLGDGTTVISFAGGVHSAGVTLNLSDDSIAGFNASVKDNIATAVERSMFVENINKIVLTAKDDIVTGSKNSSTSFDGGLGDNTLTYDGVNFGSSGVNFSFDTKNVTTASGTTTLLIGKASKSSGLVDTFTNFIKLEGSSDYADSVTIDNLDALNRLLSQFPTLELDLKGTANTSNDKVFLRFDDAINFNISTSDLTVNSAKVALNWIRSEQGGVDKDLELLFGDKNDTLVYIGTLSGRYTLVSGGAGSNTINGSTATASLFYNARTGKIASNVADYNDNDYKYKAIDFNKVVGAKIGGNFFAGALGALGVNPITYVGSGRTGATEDTLSYADNRSSLVFKFNSTNSGTVAIKGKGPSKGDSFEGIKHIIGGGSGNIFEFNSASLNYLDDLNLNGGAGTDVLYFNFTNSSNAILSSTGLSIQGKTLNLTLGNNIEVIMFNEANTDTVTIEDGVAFGLQIFGTEATGGAFDDNARKDIIIVQSNELLDDSVVTNLGNFESTTVAAGTSSGGVVDADLDTRDKVSVVFDSTSEELVRSTSGSTITDRLRGFKEIRHDSTTGKMLVIAGLRPFDYVGTNGAEGYSLYADYSKLTNSGSTYFSFDGAYNKVIVKKDPASVGASTEAEAAVYNDTLTNAGYILGTKGSDVFELYAGTTGAPTKNIIIYGNGGGDTISFNKARSLLAGGGGDGSIGNEYVLSVAGSINVNGYTLLGSYIYGLTENSDAFRTNTTTDTNVGQQVNALGGIDLLDYSVFSNNTWNITVNFTVNQVTKERYDSATNATIFAAADNMYNFERAFTGDGDDVIIANEKQLFLQSTTYELSDTNKLFDAGAGYNTLDISAVDSSKYTVELTYERKNNLNQTKIEATRVDDGVVNKTTSVGFGSILSGYANVKYVFDTEHLNEIAFGGATKPGSVTGKALNFEANVNATTAKFNFTTKPGEARNITVKLQSIVRDLVVADGTNDFINLKGYNEFNVSGNSVLTVEANRITSMKFTGGDTGNDKADFTGVSSLGLITIDIANVTGTTSSINYIDSLGTVSLNNIENIVTNSQVEVVLVERASFDASTDYTINITAGTGKDSIVSFESFTQAISGTDAKGYNLTNFTQYKLTNQADTFDIDDSAGKTIDALASGAGRDTVNFINAGGTGYTNGVIIVRENAVDTVNKINALGEVYTDRLKNFEVFALTAKEDVFTLNNNTIAGVVQPLYTEIDFAGGNDSANLSNFTGFTSGSATYSLANGFNFDLNDGTSDYKYILKNLESLSLYQNIELALQGDDFAGISVSASGNNSLSYTTNAANIDQRFIFELQADAISSKLTHFDADGVTIIKEMATFSGFYNYTNLVGNIGFKNFTDFTKNYTLFNSFTNSGDMSLVDYNAVNFDLNFSLKADKVIVSKAGATGGEHTVGAHNILLSSKNSNIVVDEAVNPAAGFPINIGLKKPEGGASFSSNVVVDLRNTANTGVGGDTLIFLDGIFDAMPMFGEFAGAPATDTIVEVTTRNAGGVTSANMNFYGVSTFKANGNTQVNLDLTKTALTKEYIFTGNDNALLLGGDIAAGTIIDINLSSSKLLNYTSAITNTVHNIKIDGFTEIDIAVVGDLNFRLSDAGISNDSNSLLINANSNTSTLIVDTGLTSSELSVINGKVNLFGRMTGSNKEFNARGFNKQITLSSNRDNLTIYNNVLNTAAFVNTSGGGDSVSYNHTSGSVAAQFVGSGNIHLSTIAAGSYGITGDHVLVNGVDSLDLGDGASALNFNIGVAFSAGYLSTSKEYNIFANYNNLNNKKVAFSLLGDIVNKVQDDDKSLFSSNSGSTLSLSNSGSDEVGFGNTTLNLKGFNYYNLGNGKDTINVNLTRNNTTNQVKDVYVNQGAGNKLSYSSSLFLDASAGGFTNQGILGILTIVGAANNLVTSYSNNLVAVAYNGVSVATTSYNVFNNGVINYDIKLGNDKTIINNGYNADGMHNSTSVALPELGLGGNRFIMEGINTVFTAPRITDSSGSIVSSYSFTSDSRDQSAFFLGQSAGNTQYDLDSTGVVTVSPNSISMAPTYANISGTKQTYSLTVTGYKDIFFGVNPDYSVGLTHLYEGNTVLKITDINNTSSNGLLYRFFGVQNEIGTVDIGTTTVEAMNAYIDVKYKLDTVDFSGYTDSDMVRIETHFDIVNGAFYSSTLVANATGLLDDSLETFNFERFKGASGIDNIFDITNIFNADRTTLANLDSPLFLEGGPGFDNIIELNSVAVNASEIGLMSDPGATTFTAGFFLKGTNTPIILFENITDILVNNPRLYIANTSIFGGFFNITASDIDNEFIIDSFKDNLVLDGKDGVDTYVLANNITYTMHKAKDGKVNVDIDLTDGTTQVKTYNADYYLTLEDGNGNTAYVFNIDGNTITQNGVDTLVDDLKLNGNFVDDSAVAPSARSLFTDNAFFADNQQNNEYTTENESTEIAINDLLDLANNTNNTESLNVNLDINEVVSEDDSLDYSLDIAFNNEDNTDNNDNDVISNDLLANITQEDLLEVESTEIVDEYKAPEEQESDSVIDVQKQLDKHSVV